MRNAAAGSAAMGLVLAGANALAQNTPATAAAYPVKPVRLVLPYPPGGGGDVITRTLAQKLTQTMGQQVIVENRGGAGGNIGMELVARSAPDGYTIVLAYTAQYAINPSLYPKLPYDPVRDFAPIVLLARSPYVLLVHPSVPARSTKELITLAKARPRELAYGSSGNGSGGHLCGETLKTIAGFDMTHVPYKGAAPALTDLLAGQVQVSFLAWASSGPHVRAGKLRALAVTTEKRSPILPQLPAVAETLPGFDLPVWYGIAAPAGTPAEIVAKLNAEILRAAATPDFRQRLEPDAVETIGGTPEQFGAYIKTEIARWAKIVKASHAKID